MPGGLADQRGGVDREGLALEGQPLVVLAFGVGVATAGVSALTRLGSWPLVFVALHVDRGAASAWDSPGRRPFSRWAGSGQDAEADF